MAKSIQTKAKPATKAASRIWNVLFCGTGGQGVLTAAEICGLAAMQAGYHVKKSEVHGMAQRGGSVESHLRFGKQIAAPLIQPQQADFLVCFHEGEGQRLNCYLKEGGTSFIPFLKEAQFQPRDPRFGNTFYLGMLSVFLPLPEESWRNALRIQLRRAQAENDQAFTDGRNAGLSTIGSRK
jgi:indolepyruvate ferredoxin oxidoreductase beta subunit